MSVLFRLLPYLRQHSLIFTLGIIGLLVARIFEALIPQFVKLGVYNIYTGQAAQALQTSVAEQRPVLLPLPVAWPTQPWPLPPAWSRRCW